MNLGYVENLKILIYEDDFDLLEFIDFNEDGFEFPCFILFYFKNFLCLLIKVVTKMMNTIDEDDE